MPTPDEINDAAKGPKKVRTDRVEAEGHSIEDQIKAAEYAAKKKNVNAGRRSFRAGRIRYGGSTGAE